MPQILDNPSHVTVSTSMGDITIELYWKHAPKTCKNFTELSRKKYYNNTIFHRIIPGFMIQGGDPTGKRVILVLHNKGYCIILQNFGWVVTIFDIDG